MKKLIVCFLEIVGLFFMIATMLVAAKYQLWWLAIGIFWVLMAIFIGGIMFLFIFLLPPKTKR